MQPPQPGGKLRPREQLKPARHFLRSKRTPFRIIPSVQCPNQCTRFCSVRQAGQLGQFSTSQGLAGQEENRLQFAIWGGRGDELSLGGPSFRPIACQKATNPLSSGMPRASKLPADNAGQRCATKCRCWQSACAWNVAYAERPAIDKGGGRRKGGRRRARMTSVLPSSLAYIRPARQDSTCPSTCDMARRGSDSMASK